MLGDKESDYVALDCEMVEGPHKKSLVAEVAVVDWNGTPLYHTFVKPSVPVVNYRTEITGLTPDSLKFGARFDTAQRKVLDLIQNKIVVGHALDNDLRALGISHAPVRNTAKHNFFKTMNPYGALQPQKLVRLHETYIGSTIQEGSHSALEDARASMKVYRTLHDQWHVPVQHEGPLYQKIVSTPRI